MARKILQAMLALTLALGIAGSLSDPAEAGRRGRAAGIAAGIIGLGILGYYAHERDRHYYRECYSGPERCGWRGRRCFYNDYGDYECRGGRYTCRHEEYCD